jgi:hypothetical protein
LFTKLQIYFSFTAYYILDFSTLSGCLHYFGNLNRSEAGKKRLCKLLAVNPVFAAFLHYKFSGAD